MNIRLVTQFNTKSNQTKTKKFQANIFFIRMHMLKYTNATKWVYRFLIISITTILVCWKLPKQKCIIQCHKHGSIMYDAIYLDRSIAKSAVGKQIRFDLIFSFLFSVSFFYPFQGLQWVSQTYTIQFICEQFARPQIIPT